MIRRRAPDLFSHPAQRSVLRVGPDGRWFELDDLRVDLSRRPPLARLLGVLAKRASEEPDQNREAATVAGEELIAAIWPGERIQRRAARNRLHVSVSMLRRMGLREVVVARGAGYAIAPAVAIELGS
jgi:hypothetical protein